MGIFSGKIVGYHQYKRSLVAQLLIPSGVNPNDYNGVGVSEWSQAKSHYHGEKHPWLRFTLFFALKALFGTPKLFKIAQSHRRREKEGHVPIADLKLEASAEENVSGLKKYALQHPEVDVIGITRMKDEYRYQGINEGNQYPWIIVVARAMDYEIFSENLKHNFDTAVTQVMGGYERSQAAAVDVANWIRQRGYYARAFGGLTKTDTEFHLTIPPAIDAGLGQLAKNGSMINDEMGSAFRMATILTSMPLIADEPREIGVDEFCKSCKKCTEDCPPGAISDEKVMVRGTMKWYVDFEKCVPFLGDNNACGICLTTCPWSRPGIAPSLSQKMLKKMARSGDAATS
ncbi:MAG: hypothetical protein CMF31_01030 [Kordiimonas sp.]|nr:hypothetical protein [Kordiimonas sp.]|tara:strand:+ start:230 stop:1261 length:1032 start_codon:yes stop_codon:yes gene_type:complete